LPAAAVRRTNAADAGAIQALHWRSRFFEQVRGMLSLIQRVTQASVVVDGETVGAIGPGLSWGIARFSNQAALSAKMAGGTYCS